MNTNQQDKLATDLGSRALSNKTNEKRSPKRLKTLTLDEAVKGFFDDYLDDFEQAMKRLGIEIEDIEILWRPIGNRGALAKPLDGPRLVPAVKVESAKSTGDVPSWLEGNLC